MSKSHMRRFILDRIIDESGVSGIGIVAEGVEFHSGHCAITWLTSTSCVAFYDNIKAIEEIHGHKGKTQIKFLDL